MNPYNLKLRELEILQLMSRGLSNGEIAKHLYLGIHTVRKDARHIYEKLGVSGRAEATYQAQQLGLLDSQPSQIKPAPQIQHLPIQLTSFIERDEQVQTILQLLDHTRLLTLTGAGGIGKTRLSIHIAEGMSEHFEDGIYFVELAPLNDSRELPKAIAMALEIIENPQETLMETLKQVIGSRQVLLVIDNFEHIMAGATLIADLLKASRNLKIIVTSREILHISGEQEYAIPPLSVYPSDDDVISEAVTLFIQRVRLVRPNFQLNSDNKDDVTAICKQLDGLPLAIELAAANCKILSPSALLKRLDTQLVSLSHITRDIPKRQQTIQATIDWSYTLLDDHEKTLFSRLAVFRSGSSLEAIEAICGEELAIDVFKGVTSLVNKSMIQQTEDDLGHPSFVMLETLRAYAGQQLEQRGELALMQYRHASYFMKLTEEATSELRLINQKWWYKKLDIEQNNIRSAMSWALSGQDVEIGIRIVTALRDYWWYQGLHNEAGRWIEQAMKFITDVSDTIRADFLTTATYFANVRGDQTTATQLREEALSLYQALNDLRGVAWCYLVQDTDSLESIEIYHETLDMMHKLHDLSGQLMTLNMMGLFYVKLEDFEQAESYFKESILIAQQTGDKRHETITLGNLGELALRRGKSEQAQTLLVDCLILARELDHSYILHDMLWTCVVLLSELDNIDAAMTLFGATSSQQHRTGQQIHVAQIMFITPYLEQLKHKQKESPAYQEHYNLGYKMALDEAVQFALSILSDD